jgi:succinyl-CoA synthetase alpha subunit
MIEAGNHVSWVTNTHKEFALPFASPAFSDLRSALSSAVPDVLLMFDEPLNVAARAMDAVRSGVKMIVIITEHVPAHDMIDLRHLARQRNAVVVGANSTGVLIPGILKAGYFSEDVCIPGRVGVLTKSGSLAYAVLAEMQSVGIGTSGVVSTGGDLVKASTFHDLIPYYENDPNTDAIVLLGEIGGSDEERAASLISRSVSKPVIAFISGKSVPPGKSIGHAGAIIRNGVGAYSTKVEQLRAAGVHVADQMGEIIPMLQLEMR